MGWRVRGRLYGVLFLILAFMTVLLPRNGFVWAGPPANGDWVVTGTESYSDQTIVLNGNLFVENGGNLTFRRVTLKLNCAYDGQWNITVKSGGKFYIQDGSIITSVDQNYEYAFVVEFSSTFRMNNSELHECGWVSTWWQTNGLQILSEDAVVENSLISHNLNGIDAHRSGIVIQNNVVIENEGLGVSACPGYSPSFYNNFISGNNQHGILACPNSSPTIYNNTITSNSQNGIAFWGGANPIIQDNKILSNNVSGITFRDNCNPAILGNMIAGNRWNGISCQNSNGTIQGNTITTNLDGVVLYISSPIIQGNIITNNTGTALHCMNQSNPTIQGNTITFNAAWGIGSRDQSKPQIHKNDIYGNGGYGLNNQDKSLNISATSNYWGSEGGPVISDVTDPIDPEEVSTNVTYTPWLTQPIVSVKLTSPLQGELVSKITSVQVDANAVWGLTQVIFFIDDVLRQTDSNSPYEWLWNTTQYTETFHKIEVIAFDSWGNTRSDTSTVTVDNTLPFGQFASLAQGAHVSKTCDIVLFGKDDNFDKMELYIDQTQVATWTTKGEHTFTWNTTQETDGNHAVWLFVYDKAENKLPVSIIVTVDNTPPAITIQNPSENVAVAADLLIAVNVSDLSNINKVEFYVNDVLTSTDMNVPYEWTWNTREYDNGEYAIKVKAYDILGNNASRTVKITVNNPKATPPLWWQTIDFLALIGAITAIGSLLIAVLSYLRKTKKEKG